MKDAADVWLYHIQVVAKAVYEKEVYGSISPSTFAKLEKIVREE